MKSVFHLLPLLSALTFCSCERKTIVIETPTIETKPAAEASETRTMETERLAAANDRFERDPSAENRAAVKKALAALEGEIAELEARVARTEGTSREQAAAKLNDLRVFHAAEQARFVRGGGEVSGELSTSPVESAAERPALDTRTGAEKLAEDGKEGARKLGEALEDAGRKAADAIQDATR